MSDEIKKQYANGIVNADEVIKSLIDKFKTDKTSVDIQQLQLIAEYLLYKVDKLQKENKKYIDIFNSTEKIMNGQERTKDKLLKENVELQKDNYKLDRENQHFFDRIQDLQKENEELKEDISNMYDEIFVRNALEFYGSLSEFEEDKNFKSERGK